MCIIPIIIGTYVFRIIPAYFRPLSKSIYGMSLPIQPTVYQNISYPITVTSCIPKYDHHYTLLFCVFHLRTKKICMVKRLSIVTIYSVLRCFWWLMISGSYSDWYDDETWQSQLTYEGCMSLIIKPNRLTMDRIHSATWYMFTVHATFFRVSSSVLRLHNATFFIKRK